jgi:hypothetical protein
MALLLGFLAGNLFTYVVLYLPSRRLSEAYERHLQEMLKR